MCMTLYDTLHTLADILHSFLGLQRPQVDTTWENIMFRASLFYCVLMHRFGERKLFWHEVWHDECHLGESF